jgi:Flp pilus assembly protein TadD
MLKDWIMAKTAKKEKLDAPVRREVPPLIPQVPPSRLLWMAALALVMGCILIYAQTADHDFINYDDPDYVIRNPNVSRGLSWEGAKWAFTSVARYYWHPLTWLSLMTDCTLFGVKPGPMHLVSAALHAANAVLLLIGLWMLTGAVWRSAFAAGLFALHPLRVESVAWIAERKDVLSGLFWILTMIAYARYAKAPSKRRYAWVFVAFLCAAMSKPSVVTLPLVLLLLDWWPLARWRSVAELGAMVKEKVPMFAVVIVVSILTYVGQKMEGATISLNALPVWYRVWNALLGYVRYIGNFLWPSDLGVLYPLAKMEGLVVFGALVILAAITGAVVWQARKRGYLVVGWLWFLGAMVPMIGLAQSGLQSFADRFTYLPAIGLSIMAGWGLAELCERMRIPLFARAGAAGLLLGVLAFASMVQTSRWKDTITLFDHTIAVTKDNDTLHFNLAGFYTERGEIDKAVEHYESALRIEPGNLEGHRLAAVTYWKKRDMAGALRHFDAIIKLSPDHGGARRGRADTLLALGRREEAKQELERLLQRNPNDVEARSRLMMMNLQ